MICSGPTPKSKPVARSMSSAWPALVHHAHRPMVEGMLARWPRSCMILNTSTALPRLRAQLSAAAMVSSEVSRPLITSTSLMSGTGPKKWMPTTLSGRDGGGDGGYGWPRAGSR